MENGERVYTSRHKADAAAHYRAVATEHRKLWTASSDDHQNARYIRPASGTPATALERILRRKLPLEMIFTAGG